MKPKYDDIKRVLGDLDYHLAAEIEAGGVAMTKLEEIAACLPQERRDGRVVSHPESAR